MAQFHNPYGMGAARDILSLAKSKVTTGPFALSGHPYHFPANPAGRMSNPHAYQLVHQMRVPFSQRINR